MKNLFKTVVIALSLGALVTGCKKDDENGTDPGTNKPTPAVWTDPEIIGNISANTSLVDTIKYELKGYVYVKAGATLTIPAGTIIKGDNFTKGTLIVEQGAKIIAEGTSARPIVFTSSLPVGQRNYGDWGGIIILGKAPQNQPGSPIIEGGVDRHFGGTDAADNSGILKYVRIEFGGIALSPNNEINGLTLGAVGSGTVIENVQISYSGDDAFEWFGGTVNAKNLIAHRTWDDDFDTDNGFVGKVQFAVALRDRAIADQSTSNGFESDNDATSTNNGPQTGAVFSNVSVFGHFATISDTTGASTLIGRGMHIRRNSAQSVFNTVITGYREGIRLDNNDISGNNTQSNMTAGRLVLKNVTLAGNVKALNASGGANLADFTTAFNSAANNNQIVANIADLKLNANNFSLTNPNFLPQAGSPLLNSGDFSDAKLSTYFDKSATFRGAFGTTDWTSGWANFNPQTTVY
ncbi:MAG: T9SS C-terminal target domain-containing protein [Bacteroidota bacterium]